MSAYGDIHVCASKCDVKKIFGFWRMGWFFCELDSSDQDEIYQKFGKVSDGNWREGIIDLSNALLWFG